MTGSTIALREFQGDGARGVAIELLKTVTYNMLTRPEQYCTTEAGANPDNMLITHSVGPKIRAGVLITAPGPWYIPATQETLARRVQKKIQYMSAYSGTLSEEDAWDAVIEHELGMAARYADYPDDVYATVNLDTLSDTYVQQLYILGMLARVKRYDSALVQVGAEGAWVPLARLRDSMGQVAHANAEGVRMNLTEFTLAHEAQLVWAEGLL